jgi:hypothetical protein
LQKDGENSLILSAKTYLAHGNVFQNGLFELNSPVKWLNSSAYEKEENFLILMLLLTNGSN